MSSVPIRTRQIQLLHVNFFLQRRGFISHPTKSIGNKRSSPKLHRTFDTGSVDRYNWNTIGHRMGTLNGLPGIVLIVIGLRILMQSPSDRCRINQKVSTFQSRNSSSFRILLIPADEHANLSEFGRKNLVAQVARSEVKLLKIARIVRNMHFSVLA